MLWCSSTSHLRKHTNKRNGKTWRRRRGSGGWLLLLTAAERRELSEIQSERPAGETTSCRKHLPLNSVGTNNSKQNGKNSGLGGLEATCNQGPLYLEVELCALIFHLPPLQNSYIGCCSHPPPLHSCPFFSTFSPFPAALRSTRTVRMLLSRAQFVVTNAVLLGFFVCVCWSVATQWTLVTFCCIMMKIVHVCWCWCV